MNSKQLYIDNDRPVYGRDIQELRKLHGVSFDDMRAILGLSINTFNSVAKTGLNAPILNPTIALLVRYYAENPNMFPKKNPPTINELEEVSGLTPKEVVLILGKEQASAFRWQKSEDKTGSNMTPVVCRLAILFYSEMKPFSDEIKNLLESIKIAKTEDDPIQLVALENDLVNVIEKRTKAINKWKKRVNIEAKARGVADIWTGGNWGKNRTKKIYEQIVEQELLENKPDDSYDDKD